MNTEPKRRGRPKNSKSFTTSTLAELNQRFKPEDLIVVGRIFLEKGVIGVKSQTETLILQSTIEGSKVEMSLQD